MPDGRLACVGKKEKGLFFNELFLLGRDVLVLTWSVQAVLLCLMPRGILVMTCKQFAGTIMSRLSSLKRYYHGVSAAFLVKALPKF